MSNYRGEKFNTEGYYDPTAYEAIRRVNREERKLSGKKPEPQKVYICSPYKGDTETNVANALRYCRFAVENGKFPIAPHAYLPQFMNDNIPSERELALSFGIRLLYGCKEIWVFGTNITEGMQKEILTAKRRGIRIKHFNEKMEEILR